MDASHQALVDRLAPDASVVAVAFIQPDGGRGRVVVRRPEAHD
ncbi:hypothetical protein [Nannocystis pusilla]